MDRYNPNHMHNHITEFTHYINHRVQITSSADHCPFVERLVGPLVLLQKSSILLSVIQGLNVMLSIKSYYDIYMNKE